MLYFWKHCKKKLTSLTRSRKTDQNCQCWRSQIKAVDQRSIPSMTFHNDYIQNLREGFEVTTLWSSGWSRGFFQVLKLSTDVGQTLTMYRSRLIYFYLHRYKQTAHLKRTCIDLQTLSQLQSLSKAQSMLRNRPPFFASLKVPTFMAPHNTLRFLHCINVSFGLRCCMKYHQQKHVFTQKLRFREIKFQLKKSRYQL